MKRLKRDDEVVVIAGKDKGKRGKIIGFKDDNRLVLIRNSRSITPT